MISDSVSHSPKVLRDWERSNPSGNTHLPNGEVLWWVLKIKEESVLKFLKLPIDKNSAYSVNIGRLMSVAAKWGQEYIRSFYYGSFMNKQTLFFCFKEPHPMHTYAHIHTRAYMHLDWLSFTREEMESIGSITSLTLRVHPFKYYLWVFISTIYQYLSILSCLVEAPDQKVRRSKNIPLMKKIFGY